jgi:N-acetylglucosamine kinase-like BadF-type ATPase
VPFFLGIDGGGTKTRCLLGDTDAILAAGGASGCNVLRVGEACARDSLAGAIHEACVRAGVSPRQISHTCAGIAGAGDDGVASLVQRLLIEVIGGAIEVIGDMEIALESAFRAEPGIIVIAGTGSVVYGKNARGDVVRAGGWGRMVSDAGSGHWIGVEAVRQALRAYDSGGHSRLLAGLLTALDASAVDDLVVRVNRTPAADFAALFPVVLRAAADGDRVAEELLGRGGKELAELTALVVGRLGADNEGLRVATHGGVFSSSLRVTQAFAERLQALCPGATLVDTVVDPALGALNRARREFAVGH